MFQTGNIHILDLIILIFIIQNDLPQSLQVKRYLSGERHRSIFNKLTWRAEKALNEFCMNEKTEISNSCSLSVYSRKFVFKICYKFWQKQYAVHHVYTLSLIEKILAEPQTSQSPKHPIAYRATVEWPLWGDAR